MSKIMVKHIIKRIERAPESSPIAVFKRKNQGLLDAVFADTVQSKKEINAGDGLVGVYHKNMDIPSIRIFLEKCERQLRENMLN